MVNDPDLLEGTSPQGLGGSFVGRGGRAPRRHGKWLLLLFDLEEVTGSLGTDVDELDRPGLAAVLEGRHGGLESALLDQRGIAGLGNEFVDELLWRSALHPRCPRCGAVLVRGQVAGRTTLWCPKEQPAPDSS